MSESIREKTNKDVLVPLIKSISTTLWRHRIKWLYPGIIITGILVYFPIKNEFIGAEVHGLHLSNMTTNLWVMIILWLWYVNDISTGIWSKIRRKKVKAPVWFNIIVLMMVIVGLIYYLTLWGYETRW